MEEYLCSLEIIKDNDTYLAKIQSDLGGVREFRGPEFETLLEQVMQELTDEFDGQ